LKRSKFNLSNYKLLTCDMGELVPIGCVEALPGDTFQHHTSLLVRTSPLNAPVMHPVQARVHHFFVPYRLIWSDWEDFITGGSDGNNASTPPTITPNTGSGFAVGSLADYLGVPPGIDDLPVSALPFRAYALIWNEFYRDQDLETELTIDLTDGADTTTNTTLKNCCWEKDYFTSARAWTQKGTAVSLPLGTSAPIHHNAADGVDVTVYSDVNATYKRLRADLTSVAASATTDTTEASRLYTNLSSATSATINELREAFALQRYKEARARYGSRYTEYLRYIGVRPADERLQRPEYLGGGKQTIQFSEVVQSGVTTSGAGAGPGVLKGHGIGAMRSNRYRKFFPEHGLVLSLLSVRPKTMYAKGLSKMWSRSTKEDFFQQELQHIGQAEILNKEVYWGHATPNGVFGYQDRYDEYRRVESSIAGEFRESTLDFWHMARIFTSDPALNSTFVSCVPTERIYQSTTTDSLQIMANHSLVARRQLAQVGTSNTF